MHIFDHIDPSKLERRDAQLWVLAIAMLLIFAAGIPLLIYPAAFSGPVILSAHVLKRVFVGFCVLSMLVVGYLMERRVEIGRLRRRLVEEEARRQRLLNEASADRLAMEFRRAANAQLSLSLVMVNITPADRLTDPGDVTMAYGDAAKAMIRKLRGEDSIYLFRPGVFGVVLPGVVAENARGVEERLSSGLAGASGDVPRFTSYSRSVNFPVDVATARQMESAAKLFSLEDRAEKAAA